jgi:hypothetical protein
MGLSLVQSRALLGLEAASVTVEVHLANGLPSFTLVGLVETEVKEARERVRSALQNAGLEFPTNKRITVNLAPADLPKESGRFDLPIALGILAASGQIDNARLAGHEFAGDRRRPLSGLHAVDRLRTADPDQSGSSDRHRTGPEGGQGPSQRLFIDPMGRGAGVPRCPGGNSQAKETPPDTRRHASAPPCRACLAGPEAGRAL